MIVFFRIGRRYGAGGKLGNKTRQLSNCQDDFSAAELIVDFRGQSQFRPIPHVGCNLHAMGTEMPINDWIDTLIAECHGDVHCALKALLLVNERLETELRYFHQLTANIAPGLEPDNGTLH